jgi:hypothetical protein
MCITTYRTASGCIIHIRHIQVCRSESTWSRQLEQALVCHVDVTCDIVQFF